MIEKEPGLIEDEQGRSAVEPGFELREQMCKHGRGEPLVLHQRVHFEAKHVSVGKTVFFGVEQRAIGPGQRIGFQRLPELRHLDERGKPG